MKALAGGATFVLGLEGQAHTRQNALIHKIVRPSDAQHITMLARKFSEALIENSAGRIDAVNDYFKRVASEICIHYFGFTVNDADAFADWTIATSALLFADPYGDENTADLAFNGAARLRAVIDNSVFRLKRQMQKGAMPAGSDDTLLGRLLNLQLSGEEQISDDEIRAILYGLVAGFIPTNTLAAAKILEELAGRPEAFKAATEAAAGGERDKLKKILLEASRLNPGLAPGQFRYCPRDTHIEVDGKRKKIKAGSLLMVSTMSAMRDKRAFASPRKFWPERTDENGEWPNLIWHLVPAFMSASASISPSNRSRKRQWSCLPRSPSRPAPGKAGKMRFLGPAPRNMEFVYDTPSATQTMFIVLADASSGVSKEDADKVIGKLRNPAGKDIRAALDSTGIVHFSSLSTIPTEKGLKIAFELSVDGEAEEAIEKIALQADGYLRPVFALAGLAENGDIADFMKQRIVMLHGKPWGATGINYNGLSEFPISKTVRQTQFADFASRVVEDYVSTETARGSHPTLILSHLRHILRGDAAFMAEATERQLAFVQEAKERNFDGFSIVTEKMRLKFTDFRDASHMQKFLKFAKTPDAKRFYGIYIFVTLICGILFWPAFSGSILSKVLLVSLSSLLTAAAILALIFALFLAILRLHEIRDEPYDHSAPLEKLRQIAESDSPPGHEQNHVMAVGKLKGGFFRELAIPLRFGA